MKKLNLLILISAIVIVTFFSCTKDNSNKNNTGSNGSLTDIDGNVYKTVTIGTQVWMAENLRTTTYRNGDHIPNITSGIAWGSLKTGAYCNYNNDTVISAIYGRLYNWYTVNDSRNIAPTGWHVPTDTEWSILTSFLEGESVAGGKLKETGTSHWWSPNFGATNESGFTALPGGIRSSDGFYDLNANGFWWSTTEGSATQACDRGMDCNDSDVGRSFGYGKDLGLSVRCVLD